MILVSMVDPVTADEASLWALLLGIGVVVLLVVVALLTWLLRIVIDIDEGVQGVWHSATRVAQNTATTWQLRETAAALAAVRDEALRHASLLGVEP